MPQLRLQENVCIEVLQDLQNGKRRAAAGSAAEAAGGHFILSTDNLCGQTRLAWPNKAAESLPDVSSVWSDASVLTEDFEQQFHVLSVAPDGHRPGRETIHRVLRCDTSDTRSLDQQHARFFAVGESDITSDATTIYSSGDGDSGEEVSADWCSPSRLAKDSFAGYRRRLRRNPVKKHSLRQALQQVLNDFTSSPEPSPRRELQSLSKDDPLRRTWPRLSVSPCLSLSKNIGHRRQAPVRSSTPPALTTGKLQSNEHRKASSFGERPSEQEKAKLLTATLTKNLQHDGVDKALELRERRISSIFSSNHASEEYKALPDPLTQSHPDLTCLFLETNKKPEIATLKLNSGPEELEATDIQAETENCDDKRIEGIHRHNEQQRATRRDDELQRVTRRDDELKEAINRDNEREEAIRRDNERKEAIRRDNEREEAIRRDNEREEFTFQGNVQEETGVTTENYKNKSSNQREQETIRAELLMQQAKLHDVKSELVLGEHRRDVARKELQDLMTEIRGRQDQLARVSREQNENNILQHRVAELLARNEQLQKDNAELQHLREESCQLQQLEKEQLQTSCYELRRSSQQLNLAQSAAEQQIQLLKQQLGEAREEQEIQTRRIKQREEEAVERDEELREKEENNKREEKKMQEKMEDNEKIISELSRQLTAESSGLKAQLTKACEMEEKSRVEMETLKILVKDLQNKLTSREVEVEVLEGRLSGQSEALHRMRDDLRRNVQEEVTVDLTSGLRANILEEVKEEVREKMKDEVREEVKRELRNEVKNEVCVMFKKQVRSEVKREVRDEVEQEVHARVDSHFEEELTLNRRIWKEEVKEKLEELNEKLEEKERVLFNIQRELNEAINENRELRSQLRQQKKHKEPKENLRHRNEDNRMLERQEAERLHDELASIKLEKQALECRTREMIGDFDRRNRMMVHEINEECRRMALILGTTARKTSTTIISSSVSSAWPTEVQPNVDASRALVSSSLCNLRQTSEEIRIKFRELKVEVEKRSRSLAEAESAAREEHERTRLSLTDEKELALQRLKQRLVQEHVVELSKVQKQQEKQVLLDAELQTKKKELTALQSAMATWRDDTASKLGRKFQEEMNKEIQRLSRHHSEVERNLRHEIRQLETRQFGKLSAETEQELNELQKKVRALQKENDNLRRNLVHSSSSDLSVDASLLKDRRGKLLQRSGELEERVQSAERRAQKAESRAEQNEAILQKKLEDLERLRTKLGQQGKDLLQLEKSYGKLQQKSLLNSH